MNQVAARTQTSRASMLPDVDTIVGALDDCGYCVIPDVIAPEVADEARSIIERFLEAEGKREHETGSLRVGRIAVKHPIFQELLCHPLILDIWRRWLGPDVIATTWSSNTVPPGNLPLVWHADYPYWSIQPPWPAGNLTGQTIWMLDDFTAENGATATLPYSHRKLARPDPDGDYSAGQVLLTGNRGSVAVLHGAMWHTSRPNRTQFNRTALLGMYARPCIVQMENLPGQLAEIEDASEDLSVLMGAKIRKPVDVV